MDFNYSKKKKKKRAGKDEEYFINDTQYIIQNKIVKMGGKKS